jgi:hypothetical protein
MSTKANELREGIELVLVKSKHYDYAAKDVIEDAGIIINLVQSYLKKEMPKEKEMGVCMCNDSECKMACNDSFNSALAEINKVLDDLTREE